MGKATVHHIDAVQRPTQLAMKADRALAKQACSGDREAFRRIVDANKQRMFTVACSVIRDASLAEDVVQEAFIKAYRALPNFRGDSRLSTWLHRITYTAAIDLQRKENRQVELTTDADVGELTADPGVNGRSESTVESQQTHHRIADALASLTTFEQTVFTLRHMQNFKLREIAQVVDRSEGTVKNILFRAIRKMRSQLVSVQVSLQEIEKC